MVAELESSAPLIKNPAIGQDSEKFHRPPSSRPTSVTPP
jgi:hypothetical protein